MAEDKTAVRQGLQALDPAYEALELAIANMQLAVPLLPDAHDYHNRAHGVLSSIRSWLVDLQLLQERVKEYARLMTES